jgi:DNA repair protein RadC
MMVANAAGRGMVAGSVFAALAPMPADSNQSPDPARFAEAPHYHGHRERLRERFRSVGADALSD